MRFEHTGYAAIVNEIASMHAVLLSLPSSRHNSQNAQLHGSHTQLPSSLFTSPDTSNCTADGEGIRVSGYNSTDSRLDVESDEGDEPLGQQLSDDLQKGGQAGRGGGRRGRARGRIGGKRGRENI